MGPTCFARWPRQPSRSGGLFPPARDPHPSHSHARRLNRNLHARLRRRRRRRFLQHLLDLAPTRSAPAPYRPHRGSHRLRARWCRSQLRCRHQFRPPLRQPPAVAAAAVSPAAPSPGNTDKHASVAPGSSNCSIPGLRTPASACPRSSCRLLAFWPMSSCLQRGHAQPRYRSPSHLSYPRPRPIPPLPPPSSPPSSSPPPQPLHPTAAPPPASASHPPPAQRPSPPSREPALVSCDVGSARGAARIVCTNTSLVAVYDNVKPCTSAQAVAA